MAQPAVYKALTTKAKEHAPVSEAENKPLSYLSESQTLLLSEQEYDGVVVLGESKRTPNEALKRGMARLKEHGL